MTAAITLAIAAIVTLFLVGVIVHVERQSNRRA